MDSAPRRLREDKPLLTVGDVRQLQTQIKADEALLKSLPAKIAADKKRLAAALVFVPEGALDGAEQTKVEQAPQRSVTPRKVNRRTQSKQVTWRSESLRILEAASKPVTHAELFEELKKTELGNKVSNGAKGFYKGLARLLHAKEIEKHGSYLYHASLAKKMRARGEEFPADRPPGGSAAIVVEILEKYPDGLSGPQLQLEIAQRKDAPLSIRKHNHYIYNILAPLKGRGIVVQEGQMYRLANGQDRKPRQMELPVNGFKPLPDFLKGVIDDGKPRTSGELGAIAAAGRGLIKPGTVPGRAAHGAMLSLSKQGVVRRTDDGKWVKL